MKIRGSKLTGWIGVVTGIIGVLVNAKDVVGSTVANVATLVGLVLAAVGGALLGENKES